MQEIPEGMIPVQKFSEEKGLSESKTIELIREGIYVGRKVGDNWYVQAEELNSTKATVSSSIKASHSTISSVVVTDIKMPFGSMVVFMVKAVLASIPAFIILFLLGFIATLMFGGIIAGLTY